MNSEEGLLAIEKYGLEEAVYVLADRWGMSTYTVEKYLRKIDDWDFDSYAEPDEYQEWADFDPDC